MVAARCLCFTLCLSISVLCSSEERGVWSAQLTELKVLLGAMDAKLSALDTKIAGVQFLEYAFKVNDIDGQLKNIDSKLHQITSQIDLLKGTSKTCETTSHLERVDTRGVSNNQLLEKINDYGEKWLVTNLEILQSVEKQQAEMETLESMYRNGFSKLHQKMEQALEMEGQMTVLSQNINAWSPKIEEIIDQLADVSVDVRNIKSAVTKNDNMLRNVTVLLSYNNARSDISSSNPLYDAVETANRMTIQMTVLEEHSQKLSTAVEVARKAAATLSGDLPASGSATLRNLVFSLTEAEKSFGVMFSSFSSNFKILYQLLMDASKTHSTNQTSSQCKQDDKTNVKLIEKESERHTHTPSFREKSSGCISGFADRLMGIKNSTDGMSVPEKLNYISSEVVAVQNSIFQQCKCVADLSTPMG